MAQIKIPDSLKAFFKKEGITDLPRILELLATVSPVVVINTEAFPVQTFPGGKLLDNWTLTGAIDSFKITVPPNKEWLLYGGIVNRDNSADLNIRVYNSDGKVIAFLGYSAAGTGEMAYPETTAQIYNMQSLPLPLKAGDYIEFAFGATQSTAAFVSAIVKEIVVV